MTRKRVLFVCMGNICRSPSAEGVFCHLVKKRGLEDRYEVDSCGTIGYHAGERADPRMCSAATRRGIELTSLARKIRQGDFDEFDAILVMDRDNLFHLTSMDYEGKYGEKIKLLADYHPDPAVTEVPDPYYGGPEGFERVLDILEVACERLLDELEGMDI